ncbi:MAG: type I polyketide synthase, partial [Pseudonocardiaceae bacterium]
TDTLAGADVAVVAASEPESLLTAVGQAYTRGAQVDWARIVPAGRVVPLPSYAFQRERYWLVPEPGQSRSRVDQWEYHVTWKALPQVLSATATGHWLVVVPRGVSEARDIALAVGGQSVLELDAAEPDRGAWALLLTEEKEFAGIVSLLALAPGDGTGVVATATLVQAVLNAELDTRVWTVTQGAVGVDEPVLDSMQAQIWGAGRAIALEHPDLWGGLVDLPADSAGVVERDLAAVLGGAEDQVALRAKGRFGRRLVRTRAVDVADASQVSGTLLITGGTGGLGGHVARWVAANGAEHVVLVSRRGVEAPGAEELRTELEALGARVTIAACDVTDAAQMAAVVDGMAADKPLSVVHTAGVVEDGVIGSLPLSAWSSVLDVKVAGTQVLEEVTAGRHVPMFVVFSSLAATLGNAGQSNYSAANACLDAMMERRRAHGLAGTSVAWGPWAGEGMAARVGFEGWNRDGVTAMDPERAIKVLQRVLARDATTAIVADIDWERFVPAFTATRPSPLLEELAPAPSAEATGGLPERLRVLRPADAVLAVLDLVRQHSSEVLGQTALLGADETFTDVGFTSLAAIQLRNRLNTVTGLTLSAAITYDYPTPRALADHITTSLLGLTGEVEQPAVRAELDNDPIVVVGMGCRFPGGVARAEDLWNLVVGGRDAISGFPDDRGWDVEAIYDPDPDAVGKSYVRSGGFLHDAGDFDAGFFGVSPREALSMDPQQRLLLEVSWEAIENADVDPLSLRGERVGVFAGTNGQDYASLVAGSSAAGDGYMATGNAASVMSGRVAYCLGLEGPAVTVDTACSSSLVALHLAVQSLRAGECTMALAGGVTVMSNAEVFVEFSRQRCLAPDGRCKAFGVGADGTGWGEGVGVLVVQRLSDARRAGRRVLAVVRGSAVNQDGASNGLTAPNGPSQQRVIRAALAQAGLEPRDVDVVEAHGTGTRLGDPIEAQALLATYGQDRECPLWLGSLKSNIGHTQAAAGVAGVIKMVMALQHAVLPRTLQADEPTTEVDWSSGSVSLLTENQEWPEAGRPRRAGVSSFGISGTNAHVILEAPEPEPEPDVEPAAGPGIWVLSGKSPEALQAQAARLAEHVRQLPDSDRVVADVGVSLLRRARFEHRAVVTGADLDALLSGLDAAAAGAADIAGRVVADVDCGVVLVFPGQGSQWKGMGRELWESSPVFRDVLSECAEVLDPLVGFSVVDVVRGQADMPSTELAGGGEVDRVDAVQPVLFAVMVALARVWQSWGVRIAGVVGHSQGEIAAACVAGGLSLEDAATVVALRSRALRALCGEGSMMSVSLPREDIEKLVQQWDGVGVAAVNGPATTVISGPVAGLQGIADECERREVRARWIPVDYASHSEHVERIEAELVTELAGIKPRSSEIPFYSTVTGELLDTSGLDAHYWYRNLRQTVLFFDTIEALAGAGYRAFVESSAHPVLVPALHDILGDTEAVVVGSLRRDEGSLDRLVRSAAEAYTRGVDVDWTEVVPVGRVIPLPTYAFQRERFWPQVRGVMGDVS